MVDSQVIVVVMDKSKGWKLAQLKEYEIAYFFFSLTWSRGYGDSLTAGFCDKASLLLSTCFPLKEVDTVY